MGKKSNRDAIGAAISIETESGRQTRMLQTGSGFLSQHSKEVLFGLGNSKSTVKATIRWPGGLEQEIDDLPHDHRVWVEEGIAPTRIERFRTSAPQQESSTSASQQEPELLSERVETWLLDPVSAPDFELPDAAGRARTLMSLRGKPVLLAFWVTKSRDCQQDMDKFQRIHVRLATQGLQLLTVNLDDVVAKDGTVIAGHERRWSFPVLRGSDDVAGIYNILYRQLFDRHRDLNLPTAFLIDPEGEIVKVYQGPIDIEHIEQDFEHIPKSDSGRLARALPFSSRERSFEFGRNYLSYGSLFFQRGYLDQAEASFQRALQDDPSSAEAAYGIGSVYLKQDKNGAAGESFERAIKLKASYPGTMADAWNNLGVLATREGRVEESMRCFKEALRLNPHHLLALDNLGNAYRLEKQWDEARKVLESALEVAPQDPEANYSLGMIFAQTDDNAHAYEYLQRALKARPVYPEALNNLGVLYLVTGRSDQAIETFEQCIKVAPVFDQSYLNLARVYALQGVRDKARAVLFDLLKRHPGHAQAVEMMKQLER